MGEGCAKCDNQRYVPMRECPSNLVTREVEEVVELIDFAKLGHWPEGGGLMYETQSFTDAYRFFLNSISLIESRPKR